MYFNKLLFLLVIIFFISCQKEELKTKPLVVTISASELKQKEVTLNGEIKNDGFSEISERGFVFSEKNANPSLSDLKVQSGSGVGIFSGLINNLKPNTKYFFKGFATNSIGTGFGETLTFSTIDFSLATIATESISDITRSSVKLSGILGDDGGGSVSEKGFCLSKSPSPTINDLKFPVNNNGLGQFELVVIKLEPNTKYYVRSYSNNEKGINYSIEKSFTTLDYSLPTLITNSATNITQNSSYIPASLKDDGGLEIIEIGLVYGESPNPTILNQKIKGATTSQNIVFQLTGLKINSKYFCRSYAINSKGISYGNEVEFSLLITHILTVKTNDVVFPGTNSRFGRITGELLDDGGLPVEDVGFVVGESPSPTISNNISIVSFKGQTTFGFSPTQRPSVYDQNLNSYSTTQKKYYVRAYASNAKERVYGNEVVYVERPEVVEKLGGFVAYTFEKGDDGYVEGEEHGYIMSKRSLGKFAYGCKSVNILGAEGSILNTGMKNTNDILNDCKENNTAAKICADYVVVENGKVYDDWFLPSQDELFKHFSTRPKPSLKYILNGADIYSFERYVGAFITSTEWDNDRNSYIWVVYPIPGEGANVNKNITGKGDEMDVIAFRRF